MESIVNLSSCKLKMGLLMANFILNGEAHTRGKDCGFDRNLPVEIETFLLRGTCNPELHDLAIKLAEQLIQCLESSVNPMALFWIKYLFRALHLCTKCNNRILVSS